MSTLLQRIAPFIKILKKEGSILMLAFILIAIKKLLEWYSEDFINSSRTFFTNKWAYIYREWGKENDTAMYLIGTTIVGLVAFYGGNLGFMFLDVTGKPSLLHKYKIQETKNVPVNFDQYKNCLKVITFNSLVIGPLFLIFTCPVALWWGIKAGYELPTFSQIIGQLLFHILMVDIIFYYAHRLLHHRSLYQRIHKIHHEWTSPISIAAIYCHPIEHVLSNLFSVYGGPILLGTYFNNHLLIMWLWSIIAIANTSVSHCGYHLPFLSSPEAHDYHHSKFNQNFGVLNWLDYIHGTNDQFLKSIDNKRHFILTGLTPVKELVPDVNHKEKPQ